MGEGGGGLGEGGGVNSGWARAAVAAATETAATARAAGWRRRGRRRAGREGGGDETETAARGRRGETMADSDSDGTRLLPFSIFTPCLFCNACNCYRIPNSNVQLPCPSYACSR